MGHTSGFKAKEKRELIEKLEPYRTHERGSGGPSRWKSDEELVWEGLRPELVVEVAFDHITGQRIRHGAKLLRWRDDKDPQRMPYLAAAFLILLSLLAPSTPSPRRARATGPADNPFVGTAGAAPEIYVVRACATRTASRSTARPATS